MEKKTMKGELTESDKRHLAICPDGREFDDIEVWPRVKRLDYSLGRLVTAGYLKRVYRDGHDYSYGRYIKIKSL